MHITKISPKVNDIGLTNQINPFSPAHCSRTDLTDPAHTKCVLKMNTFV